MENTSYNYFNQQAQPYQQPMQPYMMNTFYDPSMYSYQPMMTQTMPQPSYASSLTQDEITNLVNNGKSSNVLDINVSPLEVSAAVCNHKNGMDMVKQLNDGSGNVYCPMCHDIWSPEPISKEDLIEYINKIIASMQNAKWVGDLPIEFTRDLFPIIPLLRKWPDIYEYSMKKFNKYVDFKNIYDASTANIYNNYNSLFNNSGYQPMQPNYYGQPYQQPMQQPYMPNFAAPAANTTQFANPAVNPMQATYGVNPSAPNQQFVNQANTMMGGSVYGSYQQPMQQPMQQQVAPQQQGYTPNFTAPVTATPQQQPTDNQQAVKIDENGKIVESKNKIDL